MCARCMQGGRGVPSVEGKGVLRVTLRQHSKELKALGLRVQGGAEGGDPCSKVLGMVHESTDHTREGSRWCVKAPRG